MRTEGCREWRHLLGAYALGDLALEERAGLEAHLEGCAACRAEAETLGDVARLLPLADPARFSQPAPQPPPELADRVAATIGGKRRLARRRRGWRIGLAGGVATAAVAGLLALFILPSGGDGDPVEHVRFAGLPAGLDIYATLEPHAYGTEIHMYVKGVRSGTLCRVYLQGLRGERVPAGTFRYRWGDDSTAVLSSALDLSRTRAVGVHAGRRTFVAPVDPADSTAGNPDQEEAT
jgi:putative zinc finger protein